MDNFTTIMILVFSIALAILLLALIGTLLSTVCRREEMVESIKQLENQRTQLKTENSSLVKLQGELRNTNDELVRRAGQLREDVRQGELVIHKIEERIDTIKSTKEGLEIALYNMPAEEIHYLSKSIFCMGLPSSARGHLESNGILYIGDLIPLSEQHLLDIWGVGPASLERIKAKMSKHDIWFGMDVIRVGNHWYRRKQDELTTE